MRPNRLRELFAQKKPAVVAWMSFASSYAAEVIGHSGVDAVTLDLQHGPIYLDAALPMLQAISATPAMPMVRCSGNNFAEIGKLLDAGAYSVICPLIEDAEDARRFVAACRYPPHGTRSHGPTRGLLYGGPDYWFKANETIVTWGMIETPQSLKNINGLKTLEFFATGNDLILITNYRGADPQTNGNTAGSRGVGGFGFDYGTLAIPIGVNFGLRAGF